jgi:prepilin signal peptidase PulO-like enzyme (type II secretory pathway)
MIAQHAAEGGVLGKVGKRFESPGDDTGSHTDSLARGGKSMDGHRVNRVSGKVILVLSLIALLAVLSGYLQTSLPDTDEGAGAHIFQLSIVAVVLMILLFLATADWKQPLRSTRPLALPAAALVLAFGALYYLEHYR